MRLMPNPFDAPPVRALEVLELLSQGKTRSEVSQLMSISVHTIKHHLHHLYTHMGATCILHCYRLCLEYEHLSLSENESRY